MMAMLAPKSAFAYALSRSGIIGIGRQNNNGCSRAARRRSSSRPCRVSMLPQQKDETVPSSSVGGATSTESAPFPLYPDITSWGTNSNKNGQSTYPLSSLVESKSRNNHREFLDSLTSSSPITSKGVTIHTNRVGLKSNGILESDSMEAFFSSHMSVARFMSTSAVAKTAAGGGYQSPLPGEEDPPAMIAVSPIQIDLTDEERELFDLLRTVTNETGMKSTLRVAGGWVRDKILESKEFSKDRAAHGERDVPVTNCANGAIEEDASAVNGNDAANDEPASTNDDDPDTSLSVTVPVDIDIALDDKLGREFADELNSWLSAHGRETHSVGVVMKNPEKSKHLETATMRVNNYWIDFVNLRAEEYSSDSRIPDLMRIGTAEEDALRRDLTINSLFYNINRGVVEDMTGRGLDDLRRGIVATPLPPLTTLLDDPLRVLRSVRFAARLRFGMADSLTKAAANERVKTALEQKVSRERVGHEIDLMLKSRDPVRAMRLLVNLGLIETVFPIPLEKKLAVNGEGPFNAVYHEGLGLLGTTHDHLCDCKANTPMWCEAKRAHRAGAVNDASEEETRPLIEDENARRLLWYAAFLKPLRDRTTSPDEDNQRKKKSRKANRSVIVKLLVDDMKLPVREAESVDKIMKAANEFTKLCATGNVISALPVFLSGARVINVNGTTTCAMDGVTIDPDTCDDPIWKHSMEFREKCAVILMRTEHLWRAAFVLSLSEQLMSWKNYHEIEEDTGDVVPMAPEEVVNDLLRKYDVFAAAMMQLGLVGIWNQEPMLNGDEIKKNILPNIPVGPIFRDVMDAQTQWIITHPGGSSEKLTEHLKSLFPDFQ